jgi:hypothetical protein
MQNILNRKMNYLHWFWITLLVLFTQSLHAAPIASSSLETISTSLKSALVQNDNSFQQTSELQQKQFSAIGSKSVPLTFETSDIADLFGSGVSGASEIDAERAATNNRDYLSNDTSTDKPKLARINLDKNINIPNNNNNNNNDTDIVKSLTLSNVNSTNTIPATIATTMLSSVTESNAMSR